MPLVIHWVYICNFKFEFLNQVDMNTTSLCANPLVQSLGQVKLDSNKWKLWKNLF